MENLKNPKDMDLSKRTKRVKWQTSQALKKNIKTEYRIFRSDSKRLKMTVNWWRVT